VSFGVFSVTSFSHFYGIVNGWFLLLVLILSFSFVFIVSVCQSVCLSVTILSVPLLWRINFIINVRYILRQCISTN